MIGLAFTVALELARLAALSPAEASRVAAQALAPARTDEILALVKVESRGVAVGIHRGHARRVAGRRFWARAVAAGWLSPATCPAHQLGDGDRWGIRGAHGLAAAYSVRHLGGCVAPELLDVPIVSAFVALRRLDVLERRYGLRTSAARAEAWRRGVSASAR